MRFSLPTRLPILLTLLSFASAQPQEVPAELALRLLNYGYGSPGETTLLVAELPLNLQDLPLPEGAVVLGSLVVSDGVTRAELDAPQVPADLLAFYRAALPRFGWRLVDPDVNPDHREVFRPAAQEEGLFGCGEGDELQLSFAEREGRTELSLVHSPQSDYTFCDPENLAGGMAGDNQPPLSLIPVLVDPAGARSTGGGRSGGGDAFLAENRLRGALEPGALLEHYAQQLLAAGWRQDTTTSTEERAVTMFSLAAEGTTYQAVLTVRAEGEDAYSVFLGGF